MRRVCYRSIFIIIHVLKRNAICFSLLINIKDYAVYVSWPRFKNQLATLLMIFAIYMSFKSRSERRVREVTLCVIHFRKKVLTAICASKHAHYTFCIAIQMRVEGFLDIFFIKVGNWNWITFGLQHIGWLKFNCFNLHLMRHSIDIQWKRNDK